MSDSYALLVRCARLTGDKTFYRQLARQLGQFGDWNRLIPLAEAHGLAPLLYRHWQQSGAPIPNPVSQQLRGLVLRHRQANNIRLDVLADILAAFAVAEIPALVLKGAVLACQVYPTPELRPMNDLDLLVPAEAAGEAQVVLKASGFIESPLAQPPPLADAHHLPVLALLRDGLTVSVEIHHTLLQRLLASPAKTFSELMATAVSFTLKEQTAYTLGPAEMLWHLYQHMLNEPIRLIRIVDIVAVAERYAGEIDWAKMQQDHPRIVTALSLLHFVMPLSENLRQASGIQIGKRPSGTALALHDWPPIPRIQWPGKSKRQIIKATFFPSEFSLRLYYGVPAGGSLLGVRWFRHPWQVGRWWWQRRLSRAALKSLL